MKQTQKSAYIKSRSSQLLVIHLMQDTMTQKRREGSAPPQGKTTKTRFVLKGDALSLSPMMKNGIASSNAHSIHKEQLRDSDGKGSKGENSRHALRGRNEDVVSAMRTGWYVVCKKCFGNEKEKKRSYVNGTSGGGPRHPRVTS